VVQSWAWTFDSGLVKNESKNSKSQPNTAFNAPNENMSWPLLIHKKCFLLTMKIFYMKIFETSNFRICLSSWKLIQSTDLTLGISLLTHLIKEFPYCLPTYQSKIENKKTYVSLIITEKMPLDYLSTFSILTHLIKC